MEPQKTCQICGRTEVKDGLCRTHYIEKREEEWLDNTDRNNLGIVKWCRELMPEFAFNNFAELHLTLFTDLLKLYDPSYRNKYERLYELISFRESAKSTAANTLFCSYILAHNGKRIKYRVRDEIKEFVIDERNITIVSETATSAEEFTSRIRDVFTESERLRYYYQFQIQDAVDSLTGQWTRSAFKLNGCYVIGVGSGQQIRGKVKGASRPTLLIADDIYSENNTGTQERRDKIKRWWNNSVMNSIDNLKGKVVVLGTILHEDTVLVELERNPQWLTKKYTVMDPDLFNEFIATHIKVDRDEAEAVLPHDNIKDKDDRLKLQKEYFDKVQRSKDWKLSWPERIDLYLLAQKYKEAVHNQTVDGLYQEYFHVVIPPDSKRFRPEYFQKLPSYELKNEYGYNWIKIGDEKWKVINIEFGVDLAGPGKDGDDSVITIVGSLSDGRLFVLHQAIGKWSLRDDTYQNTSEDLRYRKVILSRDAIKRVGVIDEMFRLYLKYKPSKIKIGIAGEEEQVRYHIEQVFRENRVHNIYIQGRPQTVREGKKEERIYNTLISYYETRMVYHTPYLDKLEHQLEYLGKTTHDDAADSLECAVWQIDYPYDELNYEMFSKNDPKKIKKEELPKKEHYITPFNLKNNFREYV